MSMVVLFFSIHARAYAQGRTASEIDFLAERILETIPDIPSTRETFGRGTERFGHAREHAAAIFNAADQYASEWNAIATSNGWEVFDARRDLPALISAIAYSESRFRNVVRLDGDRVSRELEYETRTAGSRRYRRVVISDIGVMQVRAPSRNAEACGVISVPDTERLLNDMQFNYTVGTCVLTHMMRRTAESYREGSDRRRLRSGMRPPTVLRFFGAYGPREGTLDALRAQELMAIERYNWGGMDFYMEGHHASYSMRILGMLERYAPEFTTEEVPGG
jgi:hypothetical protein